jgi:hypothetical protein
MYYGFRLNEQKEWTRMKTFDTVEEFKEYVEKRRVTYAKLIDEKTYQRYYLGHSYEEMSVEE